MSLTASLLDRVEQHATQRRHNFSRAVSELLAAGLDVCAECARDASTTSPPLLEEVLDRLEKLGGEVPFEAYNGLWRAKCPLDRRHDAFLIAGIDDTHVLDYAWLDLLCAEHTVEELCAPLGVDPSLLDRRSGRPS